MSRSEKTAPVPAANGIGAPAPKRERKPKQPLDLFSAAKKVSTILAEFPLGEQLQTLRFVQGVLEAKMKAQDNAQLGSVMRGLSTPMPPPPPPNVHISSQIPGDAAAVQ